MDIALQHGATAAYTSRCRSICERPRNAALTRVTRKWPPSLRARMTDMRRAVIVDVERRGRKLAARAPDAGAPRVRRSCALRGRAVRRASQATCAPMKQQRRRGQPEDFEVDPGALAGVEGDDQIENAEEARRSTIQSQLSRRHTAGGDLHVSHERCAEQSRCTSGCLPIQKLPRKREAREPEKHRRLPLDEALIVQHQRRRAEDKDQRRRSRHAWAARGARAA